jgi:K+-transporting ATPase ATPase C chain
MLQQLLPALRIKIFLTVLCGLIYPLTITAISQTLFPRKANGSLTAGNGKAVGSELIGQNFAKPEYFHPRPSAAGANGYDAAASGGSNYSAANQKLIDRVKASIDRFRKENPDYTGPIPADLVTASASGLDPHISPDSALAQVPRVAKARSVSEDLLRRIVAAQTEGPDFGLLGEPRVNVLELNMLLDQQLPKQ